MMTASDRPTNKPRWKKHKTDIVDKDSDNLAWIAASSDEVWLFVAIGHHRHVAGRREHWWYDGENEWQTLVFLVMVGVILKWWQY